MTHEHEYDEEKRPQQTGLGQALPKNDGWDQWRLDRAEAKRDLRRSIAKEQADYTFFGQGR